MPVGHIWKFDLEKTFSLDFGRKCNFSKIRIEHVILKFLATTENIRKISSEDSNYNRGKVVKNSSGCFYDIKDTRSNPLDTVPGYIPILEYRWYGSTGTYSPSGCTALASSENLRKFPGGLSKTRPS